MIHESSGLMTPTLQYFKIPSFHYLASRIQHLASHIQFLGLPAFFTGCKVTALAKKLLLQKII